VVARRTLYHWSKLSYFEKTCPGTEGQRISLNYLRATHHYTTPPPHTAAPPPCVTDARLAFAAYLQRCMRAGTKRAGIKRMTANRLADALVTMTRRHALS